VAGHSCAAAMLAFEDCGLATVCGDFEGILDMELGEGGRVDVVEPPVCGFADDGGAVVAA
jgi:hypothetical protein